MQLYQRMQQRCGRTAGPVRQRMACNAVSAPAKQAAASGAASGKQVAFMKYQGLGNDFILVG